MSVLRLVMGLKQLGEEKDNKDTYNIHGDTGLIALNLALASLCKN